ncbi:MAG: GAF domain-containing protein [Actinomycetota bacterium]
MSDDPQDVLEELARLAAELGPALAPSGHEDLLRSTMSAAKNLFDASACSVALLDEETDELVFYVAAGAGEEDVVGMRVPAGRGIAGWVVTSGQPLAIEDVTRDPRFAADVAESTGYVPRSILAMPLETERRMIGVIEVLDRRADRPGAERDMELLSLFARQVALAIENSRVFSDLGRALFAAAADAAHGKSVGRALRRAAEEAPVPQAELAELAAYLNELIRMGPEEQRAATSLLREFVSYLKARAR